jgi:CMP-N-acetylneuraminic acid synthetase
MTLQPTSPLRRAEHIDAAIRAFAADPHADSLVSCLAVPHIFHPLSVMSLDPTGYLRPFLGASGPTRRQEKEAVFARNGAAIYITRTPKLADYVFGGRLLPFFMETSDSLDIDTEEDLATADSLLSGQSRLR